MRRWQNLAAPDDPESWYDLDGFWPTRRGTYEMADGAVTSATPASACGIAATVRYAFAGKTLSSTRHYVVTAVIEEFGGTLTDRTGGVTVGSYPMMVNYGDVTLMTNGAANPTCKSTGGNFSALAGAPQGGIVVVCRNAAVVFNTNTSVDGWAASDVGDYTNWATGEAASGRILDTPGEIIGAAVYGNDILVLKKDAIFRMTYVGGTVKWQVQLAWSGLGMYGSPSTGTQYGICACAAGIAFVGGRLGTSIYFFDGASRPVLLNPLTTISPDRSPLLYDPDAEVLVVPTGRARAIDYNYYYSFSMQAWGRRVVSVEAADAGDPLTATGVVQGDYALELTGSSKPAYWRCSLAASTIRFVTPATSPTGSIYLQTTKRGRADRLTQWGRCIPLLRRRVDLGTDVATLDLTLFTERHDTTAATTRAGIAEAANRKRFDLEGGACAANFARFKVTWADIDAEVDDFLIPELDVGEN